MENALQDARGGDDVNLLVENWQRVDWLAIFGTIHLSDSAEVYR